MKHFQVDNSIPYSQSSGKQSLLMPFVFLVKEYYVSVAYIDEL